MGILSRMMFELMGFVARNGLTSEAPSPGLGSPKLQARRTGLRGETYAYWYLRRHGYVIIARNYTAPGINGELDLVGYDGKVLAFVEVKSRTGNAPARSKPEEAVTAEKRSRLLRMAKQFLADRRITGVQCRFDVLAVESVPGKPPRVRLHKGAFAAAGEG